MGITDWALFLCLPPFRSEFSLVPPRLIKIHFHVVTAGAYFILCQFSDSLTRLLGSFQTSSGKSRGGSWRPHGPGLPALPHLQRSALPSPLEMEANTQHVRSPAAALHHPLNATWTHWAGEWPCFSVPSPFRSRKVLMLRESQQGCLHPLQQPPGKAPWTRALLAGKVGPLDLWQPPRKNRVLSLTAD